MCVAYTHQHNGTFGNWYKRYINGLFRLSLAWVYVYSALSFQKLCYFLRIRPFLMGDIFF